MTAHGRFHILASWLNVFATPRRGLAMNYAEEVKVFSCAAERLLSSIEYWPLAEDEAQAALHYCKKLLEKFASPSPPSTS